MEIGLFGSPGSSMLVLGIISGILGVCFTFCGSMLALFGEDRNKQSLGGLFCVLGLAFLVASMTFLPIGHGRQRIGDCFDSLPAATFPVDGAFQLNENVLYIVIRGKNNNDYIVSACARLHMGAVKDYPGRPIEPGEYWVVVEDHELFGKKWTTNTFMPVEPGPKK